MKTTPRSLGLDLKGSKALVSGGSRGIGSAAAELLLALGAEAQFEEGSWGLGFRV